MDESNVDVPLEAQIPHLDTLIKSLNGRICQESDGSAVSWQFCKPKLLPLKTFSIEKLEKLQQEAEEKLRLSTQD